MCSKRAGTSDLRGRLYETKLISLLYFRAVHDDTIQEFQLATNMEKIVAFTDICFHAKVKGHNKPVIMFIQAKHRENKKQALKIDLATYFDSYMKVRQNFDWIFKGTFNEIECLFIIFTNANVDYSDASATSGLPARLNDLLDMGGMIKQPNSEENIEYLTKKRVKDQISALAKWIVGFIYDDKNFQLMQSEEFFLRYHVILAQKVVDVSNIHIPLESPPYRIASFRQDFFENKEEHIILFRSTLYLEVIKRRRIEPTESDILVFLSNFLADPTDATRLSKLIGTIVTYNNGQIEFDKESTKTFRLNIKPIDVSQSTVNEAVELAAIEILSSVKFKVPAAFGNKDLTLSGGHAEIQKRICYLALKIKDLLDKCKSSKVVTIDESLEDEFLQLNGGIAGGIGNIFVLDDNTKLMKITNNCDTLGTHAKSLYTKLKSEVHNLHEYQFCFKVDKFPKLSFDCSHYEEKMARDFLTKILVYCNQAEENELQEIFKNEIEDIQRNQPNYFQAKTDAILLRYYDEIQKWWMRPQHESYLSPKIDLFRQLIDDIIKDPLMSSINLTYTSKIKQHDYTFTEDAVRSLNLQDQRSSTIIIAENCVLTVVKVLQHLKNKDHVLLDLEYIASLPTNDRNALRVELMNTNKEKVLILVCDKIDSKNDMKTLKSIAEAVKNKTNIIITDPKSLQILMLQKYFPEADKILHDKKFRLIDVCRESQKSIFESATVVFPGVELRLDHLLRAWPNTGLTPTRLREAGEADAAGVAAVTDNPTATGSRDFGMEHRVVVERKKRRDAGKELFTRSKILRKLFYQQHSTAGHRPLQTGATRRRSAGEADAAGVAAVTDNPTATGSRDFGMEDRGVVERKKRQAEEMLSMPKPTRLREAGEADAAGVAAVTDNPTATGSRDFGMEDCGVVERKKRQAEEMLSMPEWVSFRPTRLREAGAADAARVAAVTDNLTATGSRDFGMEDRGVVERKKRQAEEMLSMPEWVSFRRPRVADAANEALITDKLTKTDSHDYGMEHRDVVAQKKRRVAETFPTSELAWMRSAGEADAAGVAANTDNPTATGSRDFGLVNLGVVERKKRRDAEMFPFAVRPLLRSAGEADAAGVAAVTDNPTATGSRDFGMEHRVVVGRKKRRDAETFPISVGNWSRPTRLREAGAADAARVAAVTDNPTATGSRDFGMERRVVVGWKKRRDAETFPISVGNWSRGPRVADAANEALITDKLTKTDSHDYGMEHRDVVAQKKRRVAETFPTSELAWMRSAGEADAAGVAANTDKPTATGSRDFGMDIRNVVDRENRRDAGMFPISVGNWSRWPGVADAAHEALITDEPTKTDSHDYGMEPRDVVAQKKRRVAETFPMSELAWMRSAGEADAADETAVTDEPTATDCHDLL